MSSVQTLDVHVVLAADRDNDLAARQIPLAVETASTAGTVFTESLSVRCRQTVPAADSADVELAQRLGANGWAPSSNNDGAAAS